MKRGAAIVLLFVATVACSRPLRRARMSSTQAVTPAEVEAEMLLARPKCSASLGLFFPGLGQYCSNRGKLGLALAAAGAVELGTMLAVMTNNEAGVEHPGAAVPLIMFQDLWAFGYFEPLIKSQLARRALYAPPDSVADMIAAPFNVEVLKKPEVWLGIAGTLAAGIAVTLLVDDTPSTDNLGKDPNLFGRTMDRRVGYPLAGAVGTVLFSHVAVAEELIFRGAIQSGLARSMGQTAGWLLASGLFGAFHAFNAFSIENDAQRKEYLLIGLPFITAIGSYLGWIYRHNDYSLAPPIAVHFWYDLLLSATFFALDPQNSPLSANIRLRF